MMQATLGEILNQHPALEFDIAGVFAIHALFSRVDETALPHSSGNARRDRREYKDPSRARL